METDKNSLYMTFDRFEKTIGQGVAKATCAYFENNFQMALVECNNLVDLKDDPILSGELFYSCKISIKNKQHIILRVTSDFIRIIFHDMFGSISPIFDLEKLTELERKILNDFFEHLVKMIEDFLIKETESDKIDPLNKTNLNFVFFVKNKETNAGKMSLNIPLNRLKPAPIMLTQNFTNDDFINNAAYVDIEAGVSKISLNELKNLSVDDILVLEKSNSKIMQLKTPTVCTEIKVNPSALTTLEAEGEEADETDFHDNYKEENMPDEKSMWDDIQIEVSAEFKRVKMTLGELKQISKGLVIDLGGIMKNEISLTVENKVVAKGELVIINDKYGVKITDVFAQKRPEIQATHPQTQVPPQRPQGAPQQAQVPPPRPQGQVPPQRPQGQMPQNVPNRPHGQMPPQNQMAQPRPQGAPPQRPQGAPQQAQVPPQRPQGQVPPQRPQGAPPQKPQSTGAKDDFDYSNFEE